ncbi:MAG: YggT family protein [Bifidobacteriaceae bacterium]|nr:YggT family protein [Bifidobacteriaceae bacterium]
MLARVYLVVLLLRSICSLTLLAVPGFRPHGSVAAALELLYRLSDPPLKLVHRFIRPLRLGGTSLDLGFMVVFAAVWVIATVSATMGHRLGS